MVTLIIKSFHELSMFPKLVSKISQILFICSLGLNFPLKKYVTNVL